MLYVNPNSRLYSNVKSIIDKSVIDKLMNMTIKGPTSTPNKTETITSNIITTKITSRPTSIRKEILIITLIDSPTLILTRELTIKIHKGCIKAVIGNSVEIQTNTTTSITTRINSVLTALINKLKKLFKNY